MNRDYVHMQLVTRGVELGRIDQLITEAVHLLGNLVHYKHRGRHEDEDIVMAAFALFLAGGAK